MTLGPDKRDPVAPAERSDAAERKAATHTTPSGEIVNSFKTLLEDLGTIVRNTRQHPETGATITLDTIPARHQQHALALVDTINQ